MIQTEAPNLTELSSFAPANAGTNEKSTRNTALAAAMILVKKPLSSVWGSQGDRGFVLAEPRFGAGMCVWTALQISRYSASNAVLTFLLLEPQVRKAMAGGAVSSTLSGFLLQRMLWQPAFLLARVRIRIQSKSKAAKHDADAKKYQNYGPQSGSGTCRSYARFCQCGVLLSRVVVEAKLVRKTELVRVILIFVAGTVCTGPVGL